MFSCNFMDAPLHDVCTLVIYVSLGAASLIINV
jgi:hypothetical protein